VNGAKTADVGQSGHMACWASEWVIAPKKTDKHRSFLRSPASPLRYWGGPGQNLS